MSVQILLIDDEPQLQVALSKYLGRAGYEVVTASCGEEAIQLLQHVSPDLIICDIMMPGMNGLDLRQQLDQDPDLKNTPFIFLTAKGQLRDRLEGLHVGADDYVVKPFEPAELEARIEALLRRVARHRDAAAQSVEDLKDNILANVTHELRTPMAVVRSTLELMLEGAFGSDVVQEHTFLARALESTRSLQRLIDNLLLIASLDDKELELFLSSFSVQALLQQSRIKLSHVNPERRVILHRPEPPDLTVCADRRFLEMVLGQLLDNADRFSPAEGTIEVMAGARDEGVFVTVADRGEGIAPAHLPHIFRRFYQADMSSTRAHSGLGCGLFLVKVLVEAHGGRVEVDSQPGKGSRFTIWLPRDLPEGLFTVTELAATKNVRQPETGGQGAKR
ncbi:MAG: response regulator [Chloroflexota bacterium]